MVNPISPLMYDIPLNGATLVWFNFLQYPSNEDEFAPSPKDSCPP